MYTFKSSQEKAFYSSEEGKQILRIAYLQGVYQAEADLPLRPHYNKDTYEYHKFIKGYSHASM